MKTNTNRMEYDSKILWCVTGVVICMIGFLFGMLLVELSYNNKTEELKHSNVKYEYRIIIEGSCSD